VLDQLLVLVSVTALVMVIPGPDMILVLRNTFVGGRRAGLQTSAGVLSGNLVHITYCVLGIGLIISQSILVFSALKYAGAAYLVYLGIVSLRSRTTVLDTGATDGRRPNRTWFAQGLANNLLNPKGTLFYLGVFTTIIDPDTSPATMVLFVLAMMTVSASFWLLFVYTLDRPVIRRSVERSQLTVNRIFGALVLLMGLRVAMSR